MDRRKFMVQAGKSALAVSLMNFLNCSKTSTGPTYPPNNNADDPKPSPATNNQYTPLVDSIPYSPAEYFTEKQVSNFVGNVIFYSKGNLYSLDLETIRQKGISGLESCFYEDDIFGSKVVTITDPQRRFMPNIFVFDSGRGKIVGRNLLKMYSREIFDTGKKVILNTLQVDLPSWKVENVERYPGFVYLGDWSFNDLKDLNTNLKRGSLAITTLCPNPWTAKAYGTLVTSGAVLEGIDSIVNMINSFTPLDLNKNTEIPIYYPSVNDTSSLILCLSSLSSARKNEEDIKYLLPTEIGNSWTFKCRGQTATMKITGTKKINGKNLLVIKNTDGIEEYYGFYRDALYYYGIHEPSIGGIFFEPAVKIGDSKVRIGKSYRTNSRIISDRYSNISGSMNETITCVDREKLIVSNTPYGDCFKMKEDYNLRITKDRQTESMDGINSQWYAKNIGKVRQISSGQSAELVRANIKSRSGKIIPSLEISSQKFFPTVSQKIVDSVHKLI